jgi:hypothetical protein
MKRYSLFVIAQNILLLSLIVWLESSGTRPVHIFMAGDSTMAEKPYYKPALDSLTDEWVSVPFKERGWGMCLPAFFTEQAVVVNYAQNGHSTRRFIEEGWWDRIMSELMPGDYVVIQFGHNDGAIDKPDRYTTPEDYEKNLIRMVSEV